MKKYKPYFHAESGITFTDFAQVREYIWENREHISEISGQPLLYPNHPQWIWQFGHVLNRTYAKWVLNPSNILLMTVDEHANQEQYPAFLEKQDELRREYYREYYNREF
jgi:hypothetical protein